MKIVVIGGTGLIGSQVVETLVAAGHEAVAAAPSTGVDILTGTGLDAAMDGAEVVVDLSNSPTFDDAALAFFETAGRTIATAEAVAGVRHHVALSVVGTEGLLDSPYFRAKLAQERRIASSPVPYSLLRATQFFEFLRAIAQSATEDDIVRLPPAPFQPIAARDVAAAVAAAALAAPTNGMEEIAGPEPVAMDAIVARVLAHDRDPRRVIADPEALYFGLAAGDGQLMPGPGARLGPTRFDWWLTHVPPPAPR